MSECEECRYFESEPDVNYTGCSKEDEVTDDEWSGKVDCKCFELNPKLEM